MKTSYYDNGGKTFDRITVILFQFLLVRLKAVLKKQRFSVFQISIPTGTIKRSHAILDVAVDRVFQFLLVRLKVRKP